MVIQVLLAVPFKGGNPPGGGRAGEGEFGQLGVDLRLLHRRLLREFIAETDAIVVDAEHHIEATSILAPATGFLGKAGAQLVVVIAGEAAFAPGLLPGFIETAARLPGQHDVAFQAPVIEQETQPRRRDHRFTLALHAVGQAPFVLRFEGDGQHVAGRTDAGQVGGMGGGQGGQQQGKGHLQTGQRGSGAWLGHGRCQLFEAGQKAGAAAGVVAAATIPAASGRGP
ncbi:hypothetical protein D3C71_1540490 [compost metagenome]